VSERCDSPKYDPDAKPLLFSNGVKAYINRGTNLLFLARWLLGRGCDIVEMPEPLRGVAKKCLDQQQIDAEKRRQRIALAVKLELEGKKPSEIASALRLTTRSYWNFRSGNKAGFLAEFDRIAADTRVQALSKFLEVERRLTDTMPKAAGAVDELIENPETPAAVRARTSLELLKILRQRTVQDRIAEMDEAFGALAHDTAIGDPLLVDQCDYDATGEFIENDALPAGTVEAKTEEGQDGVPGVQ
jgi:hypothetical protein